MSDDRELLLLAAKAIGLDGYIYEWVDGPHFVVPGDSTKPLSEPKSYDWLTDDGDALRLAVALQAVKGPSWVICLSIGDNRSACEFNYAGGGDAAANVRRAIVLAAAEHAKAMRP